MSKDPENAPGSSSAPVPVSGQGETIVNPVAGPGVLVNGASATVVTGTGVLGVVNGGSASVTTSNTATGVVNNFEILKNAGVGASTSGSSPRPSAIASLQLPGPGHSIAPFNIQQLPANFHPMGSPAPPVVPLQPGVQQRQPHISRAPQLVCVPNQQAQYPQNPRVVRHITTTGNPMSPVPGPSQINGPVPPRRPVLLAPSARQPHPVPPPGQRTAQVKPRMPSGKSPIPPPNSRMVPRPPVPVAVAPQAPLPAGQPKSTFHHYRIGPGNGTTFPKGMPMWPGQGPSTDVVVKERDPSIEITVQGRKVRLTSESDPSSLYSICRRWLRNDVPRKDHAALFENGFSLPRPDGQEEEVSDGSELNAESNDKNEDEEPLKPVEEMTHGELLMGHVKRFKRVRTRKLEEHNRKLKKCKARLDFLLQM